MKNSVLKIALSALTLVSVSTHVKAYVTIGREKFTEKSLLKTAAGCRPPVFVIDLDINNVRARVMTGGDMWYNTGTQQAAYEVPKNSKKNSLYAGSCWVGGKDGNGQLKVAAQRYRPGNDYWAGPINKSTLNISEASCSEWDKIWKVDASVVADFREYIGPDNAPTPDNPRLNDARFDVIKQWPATGNVNAIGASGNILPELLEPADQYGYAPFIDVDGDKKYNWKAGDYPKGFGDSLSNPDQFLWWVFNDMGNTKLQSKTLGIGLEIQTMAFAYVSSGFLNDASFYNYRVINRGTTVLNDCYMSTWTDADLGYPFDDYIGCDTNRGLGILYNSSPTDGANGENSYGTRLPMIGVDFFVGPRKDYIDPITGEKKDSLLRMTSFSYFENSQTGNLRDPDNGVAFYNYMRGFTYSGIPFSNDQSRGKSSVGYGAGPVAPYVFYGDPGINGEWSQCFCQNPPADRRFIHSAGPFTLEVGVMNDITIGVVWVDNVGGCGSPGVSFKKIKAADDIAQALFDAGFARLEAPDAPILTIREMDKKLICYLTNPKNSNNYGEKYTGVNPKAAGQHSSDSLYKFEGYRVFQLRSPSDASIYDESGKLTADAVEVYQCDIKNGIKQITNYTKNLEVQSSVDQFDLSIKVNGKDSGISHTFILTQDAFALSQDKSLVNYKTYYYKVVAYANNNFAQFDPSNEIGTQDEAYIESNNAPGRKVNKYVTAMPNSMNQNGDTFSNATAYGQGVVITRIEGSGNGGRDLQLTQLSEDTAVLYGKVNNPVYEAGKGPIGVRIVDPVMVKNTNWRVVISGTMKPDTVQGLADTSTWKIEELDNSGAVVNTIFSETSIALPNEQILDRYGISVTINQALLPGVSQESGNGYITSDATFANTSLPWLTGVRDVGGISYQNWIRSGTDKERIKEGEIPAPCGPFSDYRSDSIVAAYSNMFPNNTNIAMTWAPYDLADTVSALGCGFGPAAQGTIPDSLYKTPTNVTPRPVILQSDIPSVDLVFTADKSKWTRCVVLESGNDPLLTEGNTGRLRVRSHRSWNMDIDNATNRPVYASDPADVGFSYFPGYAVDQNSGERLNIAFAEDSYLKGFNGADMIWNPTTDLFSTFGEVIFGGKHFTYILNTKYDSCKAFANQINIASDLGRKRIYRQMRWVGIPMLAANYKLLSLQDGLIPTTTRLRFRVNTPYRYFNLRPDQVAMNNRQPVYTFSTQGLAPTDWTKNTEADVLMDKIVAVPNPYKGQAMGNASYESNKLETKIKIINLPNEATVDIYSLDGTLVRRLTKNNNEPFLVWDLYNAAGLPIGSGMYLIHVKAYGKDKVIRWFGAMRPLDVTNY